MSNIFSDFGYQNQALYLLILKAEAKRRNQKMKRMTTEVIAALQELVDTYGDLPFEVLDADNGVDYFNVTAFAKVADNLGEDETPAIGLAV